MAKQEVLLRNIVTKDKPPEMLEISPKGTVPILIFDDGRIIDESLDIMIWALNENDPSDLLYKSSPEVYPRMLSLIKKSDIDFRKNLSEYKYQRRYHLEKEIELRDNCVEFILELESSLKDKDFLMGNKLSLADLAVLPFIRQFAGVDKKWFRTAGFPHLSLWLANQMQSLLFSKSIKKYDLWNENHEEFLLSWNSPK